MYINKTIKGNNYTFQFDKNGGLCNITPRDSETFNFYHGRTINFLPDMIESIKNNL